MFYEINEHNSFENSTIIKLKSIQNLKHFFFLFLTLPYTITIFSIKEFHKIKFTENYVLIVMPFWKKNRISIPSVNSGINKNGR